MVPTEPAVLGFAVAVAWSVIEAAVSVTLSSVIVAVGLAPAPVALSPSVLLAVTVTAAPASWKFPVPELLVNMT